MNTRNIFIYNIYLHFIKSKSFAFIIIINVFFLIYFMQCFGTKKKVVYNHIASFDLYELFNRISQISIIKPNLKKIYS